MSKLFPAKDFFLIPNLITYLRFILIAPMIYTFNNGMKDYFYIILFVSLFTDFIDGIIARKLNQTSELGKTLDPIADGITLFAFTILLTKKGFIGLWFCWFYFLRQLVLLIFSLVYVPKLKTVIGSNFLGKTGVCVLAIVLCIYAIELPQFYSYTNNLLIIAAVLLSVSLSDYIKFFLIQK
jgi:cardiolipin synthase